MPKFTTDIDGRPYVITHATTAALVQALLRMEQHDERLNGTAPGFDDAQAPDGDDYNHVMAEAYAVLRLIRGE